MKFALVYISFNQKMPQLGVSYLYSGLLAARIDVKLYRIDNDFLSTKLSDSLRIFTREYHIMGDVHKLNNALKNKKFKILNAYLSKCAERIISNNYKVAGFSVYINNFTLSFLLAMYLKTRNDKIKIIFGGPHMYSYQLEEACLRTKMVDYVFIGEGEKRLPLLIKEIYAGKNDTALPGIAYLNNGRLFYDKNWQPQKNINNIKFPVFTGKEIRKMRIPRMLPITTSRGCPFRCSFCRHHMLTREFRQRSPENVIKEIEYQIEATGIRNYYFNDASIQVPFLKRFCALLIKRNINIKWIVNGLRGDKFFNKEVFDLMYLAGCRGFQIGVESGSDKVLRDMNKQRTVREAENCIRLAAKSRLFVYTTFMVGFPTETEYDFAQTVSFIVRNKEYINRFWIFSFYSMRYTEIDNKKNNKKIIAENIINRKKILKSIFGSTLNNMGSKPPGKSKYNRLATSFFPFDDLFANTRKKQRTGTVKDPIIINMKNYNTLIKSVNPKK